MVRQKTEDVHIKRADEIVWLDSGIDIKQNSLLRLNSVSESTNHKGKHKDVETWTQLTGDIYLVTEEGMKFCLENQQQQDLRQTKQQLEEIMSPLISIRSPMHDRSFVISPFPVYGPYSSHQNNHKHNVHVRGVFLFLSFLSHGPKTFTELHVFKNGKLVMKKPLLLYNPKETVSTLREMIQIPKEISTLLPGDELSLRVFYYALEKTDHTIDCAMYCLATDTLDFSDDKIMLTGYDNSGDGILDYYQYHSKRYEVRGEYTVKAHDTQYAFMGGVPHYDYVDLIQRFEFGKPEQKTSVLKFQRNDGSLCVNVPMDLSAGLRFGYNLCEESNVPKGIHRLSIYGLVNENVVRVRIDPDSRKVYAAFSDNRRLFEEQEISKTYDVDLRRLLIYIAFVDEYKSHVFVITDQHNHLPPQFLFYDKKTEQWIDSHPIFGSKLA